MASTENITPRQLAQARMARWHQDGSALRTIDDARAWLDAAGLVPFYPHAQFATPSPSFAEAVLGRPENGWIPRRAKTAGAAAHGSEQDSMATEAGENGAEDAFEEDAPDVDGDGDPEEEDLDAEDDGEQEDNDEEEGEHEDDLDAEDDEEQEDGDEDEDADPSASDDEGEQDEEIDPSASDDEIMLSNDDELNEDEGDEIAEEDRIRAQGDPLPNGLRASEAPSKGSGPVDTEADEPAPEPVNGFTNDERETVQRTLARLVAEGSAVPLNLLGSTTGQPDYVCSAQAFSFVYTLRGDKTWKQEPAQTGSMRVSPLAAKVYATLKEKGEQAPHQLSQELGQGIVDSAVLRALSELWAIQRVVPIPDGEGKPAKWEVMTGRFMRHIKAGANAGQPTALSALLSLYLSQTIAATGDEMEIFLSPLVARSRVREVVHGLSASQQLDTLVIEGKTLLHIAGDLPEFAADDSPRTASSPQRSRYERDDRMAADAERAARGPSSREGRPERTGSYPVRKPAGARAAGERGGRPGGARPSGAKPFGARPSGAKSFGSRPAGPRSGAEGRSNYPPRSAEGPPDRERRPFTRRDAGAAPGGERNQFARPWDDDRRPAGEASAERPTRDGASRERSARPGNFGERAGGARPAYGRTADRAGSGERRPSADRKPYAPREGAERNPYPPREGAARKPFAPGEGRERRPYAPREGGGSGERRPFARRDGTDGGERRPFVRRDSGDRPSGERKPFSPRDGGERKPFPPRGDGGERRPYAPREGAGERRPYAAREGSASGERRPFVRREGGDRSFTDRKPFAPREEGERRPFVPRDAAAGGERRPYVRRDGNEGGERRPSGDRKLFQPREGGSRAPFVPRAAASGGEGRSFGDRKPAFGPRKPFGAGSGGDRNSFGGPRKPFGENARPARERFSGEPGEGRPSFQSGAHSAGPGGAKFGGSGSGKGLPGKFGRPGFSPARKGPGGGPGRGGAPKRRAD